MELRTTQVGEIGDGSRVNNKCSEWHSLWKYVTVDFLLCNFSFDQTSFLCWNKGARRGVGTGGPRAAGAEKDGRNIQKGG